MSGTARELARSPVADAPIHRRAFRSVDEFVVEAFKAARRIGRGDGAELAASLRAAGLRCGASLLAAAAAGPRASAGLAGTLRDGRAALLEARYALYVARRLGMLDLRSYRGLADRQDAALRDLEGLIRASASDDPG